MALLRLEWRQMEHVLLFMAVCKNMESMRHLNLVLEKLVTSYFFRMTNVMYELQASKWEWKKLEQKCSKGLKSPPTSRMCHSFDTLGHESEFKYHHLCRYDFENIVVENIMKTPIKILKNA